MNVLGFTSVDLTGLFILAIIILVILFVMKFVMKMAFGVVKMGCLIGILIVAAVALFMWLI